MEPEKKLGELRDFRFYISKALKFFDLKDEKLTPIIFTILLIVNFAGAFLPEEIILNYTANITYTLITVAIMYIVSSTYLIAYIKELRGQEYDLGTCAKLVGTKSYKILFASMIYFTAIAIGSFLLIIPGLIIYIMFLFHNCYILDRNESIKNAFISSKEITNTRKMSIFSIIILFNLVLFIPVLFIMIPVMSSNNGLVFSFVISFVSTIINLMQQRLTALMYIDLTNKSFSCQSKDQII